MCEEVRSEVERLTWSEVNSTLGEARVRVRVQAGEMGVGLRVE